MKKYIILIFTFAVTLCLGQVPGAIYQKATGTLGQKVLDPNNDGFISNTTSGFSVTDFGANSEMRMVALPVFEVEPINDLSTGSGGGHTDIASAGTNQSCYILKRTVEGIDYLVVRFRLGGASTASKGYSLLIDSDSNFGTALSANNLGFDREIVYETGNNGRIAIYKHELNNSGVLLASFNVHQYAQRSVAFSTVGGNADYFYDFFVPLDAIQAPNLVRFTAVTVTSAGSGVLGTISDFNGIDDSKYNNNSLLLQQLLISTFPAVLFDDLDENFNPAGWLVKSATPSVNNGLTPTSTTIAGTSTEANGTTITVFKNGVSTGTTTVTSNAWALTGVSGLVAGDLITATATASGKSVSDLSQSITVFNAIISSSTCNLEIPAITGRDNGQRRLSGTAPANSIVTIYKINSDGSILQAVSDTTNGTNPTQANSSGVWGPISKFETSNTIFTASNYIAKATLNNCTSDYSLASSGGIITVAPQVMTSPILESASSTNITVQNNHSNNANILFYVNGQLQGTINNVANNNQVVFNFAGLNENDVVYARAIGTASDSSLSGLSNQITVGAGSFQTTSAPIITGSYSAGSNSIVKGTSVEIVGTVIKLYSNGVLSGSTTVSTFGTWEVTGLTLTSGNVLTAKAKATSKSLSDSSNAVTVTAAPPTAPTIANEYTVGNTVISGTGGLGVVQVYIDGALMGTATPSSGSWSMAIANASELYKGAEITARNLVSGTLSPNSNIKTVTGIGGFCITLSDGSPLPANVTSGQTLSIKITAIAGSTCPGTPFTGFIGTAFLSSNNLLSPLGTTPNFVNGVLTLDISFGGLGSVELRALNSDDPSASGVASTNVINSALWVGSTNTDFNTASNWSGNYVPGQGAFIEFASNVANDLHLDTNRLFGGLDFNTATHTRKLVLGNHTLEIRGSILNNTADKSFMTTDGSKLNISGSGSATTLFFAPSSSIDELIINKSNNEVVTIGSPLRVLSFLNISQGSLNANGNITLASTANRTAVVPLVRGTITGNVIVEKFIPAKRAFRFFTSSVTTTTPINAHWQEGATNTTTSGNLNPNPGYGTHITGDGQNGLDATQTTNYSMFTYNNTSPAWVQVTNTNTDVLVAGKPYRMLVRGDRSINLNTNTPPPTTTTLRATGTLVVGDFEIPAASLNQTTNTFSLIGNPYQAKVSMRAVLRNSGFQKKVWYWNPNINTRGGYVPVDFEAAQDLIGVQGVGNNNIVFPGASFFVRKQGGTTSSIVFKEIHKIEETSNATLFRQHELQTTASSLEKINITLHENGNTLPSNHVLDGIVMVFNENFDTEYTSDDMAKFSNLDEDLAVYHGTNRVSIEKRNFPIESEIIPIGITKYRHTNYRFDINLTDYSGLTPYLYDAYLNTYTELTPGNMVDYEFNIQADAPESSSVNRFSIVFQNLLSNPDFVSQTVLHPNPGRSGDHFFLSGISNAEVTVNNLLGQNIPVKTIQHNNSIEVAPNHKLAVGMYLVNIVIQGKKTTLKWIIK